MIKVKIEDLEKASPIFAKAMFKDPLHIWFFPNEDSRYVKLTRLYRFKLKMDFNNLYATSNSLEGLVIWKGSKKNKFQFSFFDLLRGVILILSIGINPVIKMVKYQKWITRLHKLYLKKSYCCLDILVIDPSFQGQGFSSILIKPKLLDLSLNNEIAFLETQNKNNVNIYEHFGFKLIYQEKLPKTEILSYGMVKS
ncbi:MAG: GNAT family N-acetyltransferase [Candidatus Izemoplasmatales bacterium]|nr:GNAT family N-acetyltransferase [Candidatus Izemoplasmatales bacterium]